jgi:pentatricopeptide repeat domain-containing protein 1
VLCYAEVRPDAVSYGAAMVACSKGGQWQLAVELLRDMQQRGKHAPYSSIYGIVTALED